jgi:hypothetical protein
MLYPVPRYVAAARDPHTFMTLYVVEEAGQRLKPARAAEYPRMHRHRHHLRGNRSFGIETVKGVLEVVEELIPAAEAAGGCLELHVGDIGGVGNDEMGALVIQAPIGEVVGV